ncbi:MAG: J domain-containing protein [Alphaproteobacteria bacterium]|nr:J domain-containing protein [Alphaproteobacteria bacterium]
MADRISHRHANSVSSRQRRKSSNSFSCFFTLRHHNLQMAEAKRKARFKHDMRIKPDQPKKVEPDEKLRPCARPGCEGEGNFKVTRSRERLGEYIWLCLDHAREHNESWDFFRGMDEKDIESFRNEAITGHRPTWPLGKRAARMQNPFGRTFGVQDGYGTFEKDADSTPQPRRPERTLTRLQVQALDTLHLAPNATLIEIKARYKELVKRFHPDANGGDRGAEERLKQVIKAYGVLRASGLT